MAENLKFISYLGDQPWFFVPDTGAPGGTGVLITPKGREVPIKRTQNAGSDESTFGRRFGVQVPEVFTYEGEYLLRIDQDGTVTEYEITVTEHPDVVAARNAEVALERARQRAQETVAAQGRARELENSNG